MSVELTGRDGVTITLSEAIDGTCQCCGERRDVTMLTLRFTPGREEILRVCGRCIAAALAVRIKIADLLADVAPPASAYEVDA